jgi:hypothetical protein
MGPAVCHAIVMGEEKRTIRVTRLRDQGNEPDLKNTTPEERVGMMWQLALDAWAMRGDFDAKAQFPRHVVRVIRRKSKERGDACEPGSEQP